MARIWAKVKGFTLVELLIVVAIVGVLATVGVPTFRKMVQKAKKSEAKVALGGLYTVEAAFFSEYGTYGNNIDKVGFELDGTAATRIFKVGFNGTDCKAVTATQPDKTAGAGSALNLAFPAYFNSTATYLLDSSAPGAPTKGCVAGDVVSTGQTFTAAANGNITGDASSTAVDQWTIDQNRNLQNVVDGTK